MTVHADVARRRIEELLGAGEEQILRRWSTVSGASPAELRELYRALRHALAQESADLTDVRGLLAELSRSRARQGHTPPTPPGPSTASRISSPPSGHRGGCPMSICRCW